MATGETTEETARQAGLTAGRVSQLRRMLQASWLAFQGEENPGRYLHTMDLHHALIAFDQRDKNIEKQKRAATRDLESFLEFNPNAAGQQDQFKFNFMTEEPVAQEVQTLEESKIKSATEAIRTTNPS